MMTQIIYYCKYKKLKEWVIEAGKFLLSFFFFILKLPILNYANSS